MTKPKEQHKDADLGNLALMIAMNHPHPSSSGLDWDKQAWVSSHEHSLT